MRVIVLLRLHVTLNHESCVPQTFCFFRYVPNDLWYAENSRFSQIIRQRTPLCLSTISRKDGRIEKIKKQQTEHSKQETTECMTTQSTISFPSHNLILFCLSGAPSLSQLVLVGIFEINKEHLSYPTFYWKTYFGILSFRSQNCIRIEESGSLHQYICILQIQASELI